MEEGIIYDPVGEYKALADAHKQNAADYFDSLVTEAGVDIESNRATIKQRNEFDSLARAEDSKAGKGKGLRVFLIILCVVAGLAAVIVPIAVAITAVRIAVPIACAAVIAGLIVLIVVKINKSIKAATAKSAEYKAKVSALNADASAQMASLNALFKYDMCEDLVEKTLPLIAVDQRLDAQKLDYIYSFGVRESDNDTSVRAVRSGASGGDPFLMVEYYDQITVSHTYTGTRTVTWTETVTDSDGHTRTVTRSQTLTAHVTKPKPDYVSSTYLYYVSDNAPDLSFSRGPVLKLGSSDKDVEKKVKKGEKEFEKKAQKAIKTGGTFTKLANSEFEVLFGAEDRDHEVQFRLMFTPLAQQNMVKIIKERDDFSFVKRGKLNAICRGGDAVIPEPGQFRGNDHDGMRDRFINFNCTYFETLYYAFRPLFAIPLYQTERSQRVFTRNGAPGPLTPWEVESDLYFMRDAFVPDDAATETLLHVTPADEPFEELSGQSGSGMFDVTGYSFRGEQRTDFVPVMARNGRLYEVPVPWIEYIPIERTRRIAAQQAEGGMYDPDAIHGVKVSLL